MGAPDKSSRMTQAFILGAGLGTRLKPLTDRVPKPLVPLFHRPLVDWTLDACRAVGVSRFAINTHHLPATWDGFRDSGDISLFHEPVLLETGGGLKNISDWIADGPLLVHNGDIFSTLPLKELVTAHHASGLPVTLAVRSVGKARHIALNHIGDRVVDIHGKLGKADGTHVFTGIYCINKVFLDLLEKDRIVSVIPAFLHLAAEGKLGAVVLDDGVWLDLGERDSYLEAHQNLQLGQAIHPDAVIDPTAVIENSVVGPGAVVGAGATIVDSVIWPGGEVFAGAQLNRCIVCSGNPVGGAHFNADL
jgi:mannose-1-phosphate guanylyltransferase